MKVAKIQFVPWDKEYFFDPNNFELETGDKVIVKTELGTELGVVVGFEEVEGDKISSIDSSTSGQNDSGGKNEAENTTSIKENQTIKESKYKPVVRIATPIDLEKLPTQDDKSKALEFCKKMKEKHNLQMKFIDVHFSFDGSRITFAFIADGRVDFRELVKDLTRHFGRTIRLQQIGIRDEAKVMGDYGHCGRCLCCKKFLNELVSITSEMSEIQQCSHRGSERISGICGRLMCCLAYEQDAYEELAKSFPPIGKALKFKGKRGTVVGHHFLRRTVDIEFPAENGDDAAIVEMDLSKLK